MTTLANPRARKHLFEGERLTIKQIRERVPVFSETTISILLKKGFDTRVAMLSRDPTLRYRAGGIRNSERAKAAGLAPVFSSSPGYRERAAASGFIPKHTRSST